MYYRLYASKNNTIFQQFSPNTTSPQTWSQLVNTGSSPVLEVMDGSSQSKVLLGFILPDWLRSKLVTFDYTCNLKIFDAGAQYDSLLPMKQIKLEYFPDDFSEGNGWYFNYANSSDGISNWINNLDGSLWSNVNFSLPVTYNLNKDNEDLSFDVTSVFSVYSDVQNSLFNFALSVVNPQVDENTLIKFLWGRHTKTVFQPYVEFFINDEIVDSAFNCIAGQSNNIYFINENGIPFSDVLTAHVQYNDIPMTEVDLPTINPRDGVYYATVTPFEPFRVNKAEYISIVWKIGPKFVYKQMIEVVPQDNYVQGTSYRNLMFYPATPYSNNIVRLGDVMPFEVISQIRSQGDVTSDKYKYRVVAANGFEVVPWSQVSVYRNKMFFSLRTDFLYPEMQYEVFLMLDNGDFQITSNTTYKFKLTTNEASHLRTLSASPYYNRESFFGK